MICMHRSCLSRVPTRQCHTHFIMCFSVRPILFYMSHYAVLLTSLCASPSEQPFIICRTMLSAHLLLVLCQFLGCQSILLFVNQLPTILMTYPVHLHVCLTERSSRFFFNLCTGFCPLLLSRTLSFRCCIP